MTFAKKELIKTLDEDEMIHSPAVAVLIQHPLLGNILYDTGNDEMWEKTYSDDIKQTYPISRCITIEEALSKEGMTPRDIDVLILSHLHFDHVGGLKFFVNTKAGKQVYASSAELKDVIPALYDVPNQIQGAYIGSLFLGLPGINYVGIEKSYDLGQGISVFTQSCHTAGLLGLKVELESGVILFVGDTVYTSEAYEKELPPGGSINKTDIEFINNVHFLKNMQKKENAKVFFGHDYNQARAWQQKGWIE